MKISAQSQIVKKKVKTAARRCRAYLESVIGKKKPLQYTPNIGDNVFLFIGGLHRSGTSVLHRLLREHPDTSGFRGLGGREDEGQHLQSVFPTAAEHGGPGRFVFHPESHFSECSDVVSDANRQKLLRQWGAYYDLNKKVLLEKSPPNIVRSRSLQALFGNSCFVFIVRHPIAVSLSTQNWSKTPLIELMRHWHKAHEYLYSDLAHLNRKLVLRYEDLVESPGSHLSKICELLEIDEFMPQERLKNHNDKYFSKWAFEHGGDRQSLNDSYPEIVHLARKFGYSFDDQYVTLPSNCITLAADAYPLKTCS